jgi:hypothetical protein
MAPIKIPYSSVVLTDFKEPVRVIRDTNVLKSNEKYIFGSVRVALGHMEDASDFKSLVNKAKRVKLP